MNDREFNELVARAAEEHQATTPIPRERMWQKVQTSRRQISGRPWSRYLQASMAVAAVLIIGIGIGRWSNPVLDNGPVALATSEMDASVPDLYLISTLTLFNSADALLTDFQLGGFESENREPTGRWAADMLRQTRLLQGTPAGDDPELEGLLTDLELVLAQIISIGSNNSDQDVAWIRSGLHEKSTIDRLRAVTDRRNVLDPL